LIIGKGGANLREISKQTGAEVTRRHGEVHIISGTEEQREHVKVVIAMKVVGRSKTNFFVTSQFNTASLVICKIHCPQISDRGSSCYLMVIH